MAVRTIGTLLAEARTLLQDKEPSVYRYSDAELMEAFNGALNSIRAKRPDLFLDFGLHNPTPFFTVDDVAAPFPLDLSVYEPMVYYVVGRSEMREDSFSNDSRAVNMMNKFVSGLLSASS